MENNERAMTKKQQKWLYTLWQRKKIYKQLEKRLAFGLVIVLLTITQL